MPENSKPEQKKIETATKNANQKLAKISSKLTTKIKGLTQGQKKILAIACTLLVILLLVFANRFLFNQKFRNRLLGKQDESEMQTATVDNNGTIQDSLANLRNSLNRAGPEDLIAEEVNLEDLNIYPTPWLEKYFNDTERKNTLISGPGADADSDGLSNQKEYFLGSDPRNKYTLCGKNEGEEKCKKTDKENYDSGINPLSGVQVEEQNSFTITRLDKKLVQEIQDSFTNASKNGVDFPAIYQQSRKLDLTGELNAIKTTEVDDNRDNVLKYLDVRIQILGEFSEEDALSSFTQVYKLIDPESLKVLKQNYQSIVDRLKETTVPKTYSTSHKATILTLQKTIELIDMRIEGLTKANLETEEFKQRSQKKSQEMIWAFIKLNDESKVFNETEGE